MTSPRETLTELATETGRSRYWLWTTVLTLVIVTTVATGTLLLDTPQIVQTALLLVLSVLAFLFGRWVSRRVEPDTLSRTLYKLPEDATVKRSQTTNSALEYRYHISVESEDVVWSYTGFKKPNDRAVYITEWSSAQSVFGTHTRDRTEHDQYKLVNPSNTQVRFASTLHETPKA